MTYSEQPSDLGMHLISFGGGRRIAPNIAASMSGLHKSRSSPMTQAKTYFSTAAHLECRVFGFVPRFSQAAHRQDAAGGIQGFRRGRPAANRSRAG